MSSFRRYMKEFLLPKCDANAAGSPKNTINNYNKKMNGNIKSPLNNSINTNKEKDRSKFNVLKKVQIENNYIAKMKSFDKNVKSQSPKAEKIKASITHNSNKKNFFLPNKKKFQIQTQGIRDRNNFQLISVFRQREELLSKRKVETTEIQRKLNENRAHLIKLKEEITNLEKKKNEAYVNKIAKRNEEIKPLQNELIRISNEKIILQNYDKHNLEEKLKSEKQMIMEDELSNTVEKCDLVNEREEIESLIRGIVNQEGFNIFYGIQVNKDKKQKDLFKLTIFKMFVKEVCFALKTKIALFSKNKYQKFNMWIEAILIDTIKGKEDLYQNLLKIFKLINPKLTKIDNYFGDYYKNIILKYTSFYNQLINLNSLISKVEKAIAFRTNFLNIEILNKMKDIFEREEANLRTIENNKKRIIYLNKLEIQVEAKIFKLSYMKGRKMHPTKFVKIKQENDAKIEILNKKNKIKLLKEDTKSLAETLKFSNQKFLQSYREYNQKVIELENEVLFKQNINFKNEVSKLKSDRIKSNTFNPLNSCEYSSDDENSDIASIQNEIKFNNNDDGFATNNFETNIFSDEFNKRLNEDYLKIDDNCMPTSEYISPLKIQGFNKRENSIDRELLSEAKSGNKEISNQKCQKMIIDLSKFTVSSSNNTIQSFKIKEFDCKEK